jgi:hypothetical protein
VGAMACGWGWAGPRPLGGPLPCVDLQGTTKVIFCRAPGQRCTARAVFNIAHGKQVHRNASMIDVPQIQFVPRLKG